MDSLDQKKGLFVKSRRITLPGFSLVGLTARTKNALEFDPTTAQIGTMVQGYFSQQKMNDIPHRKTPGVTFSVYTEYETDHTGFYTYFIGEAVTTLPNSLPSEFLSLTIPAQNYMKLTTEPGPMPQVVIQAPDFRTFQPKKIK